MVDVINCVSDLKLAHFWSHFPHKIMVEGMFAVKYLPAIPHSRVWCASIFGTYFDLDLELDLLSGLSLKWLGGSGRGTLVGPPSSPAGR